MLWQEEEFVEWFVSQRRGALEEEMRRGGASGREIRGRALVEYDRWQGSGKAVDKGWALIRADEKVESVASWRCALVRLSFFAGTLTGRVP